MELVSVAFTFSLLAGLATGAGAFPIFLKDRFSDDTLDTFLGFTAGVMLSATFFNLLIPAIEISTSWMVIFGIMIGAILLHFIDRFVPHFHPVSGPEGPYSKLSRNWLLIIAMIIHNFPEGLAVGISFASNDVAGGPIMATAIGIQNMPEGLAVALALIRENYNRIRSLGYATLTGLVEPIGGIVGVALGSFVEGVLPLGLSFAAGAMLFVVIDELIPESHKKGFGRRATFGLMIGLVLMIALIDLFG